MAGVAPVFFDDDDELELPPLSISAVDAALLARVDAILEGEELDAAEAARQARIDAGVEHACAGCGCSQTRACPGRCVWATERLCSRCIR